MESNFHNGKTVSASVLVPSGIVHGYLICNEINMIIQKTYIKVTLRIGDRPCLVNFVTPLPYGKIRVYFADGGSLVTDWFCKFDLHLGGSIVEYSKGVKDVPQSTGPLPQQLKIS